MYYKCSQQPQISGYITYEQMNILISVQKMWMKIVYWVRTYTRSVIFNTPDEKFLSNFLINLPDEIYNFLNIFYGFDISNNIKSLVLNFIMATIDVIQTIKLGDRISESSKTTECYKIADSISLFLAQINVYWDQDQWRFLLYQYIKMKIDEIHSIVNGDYDQEIKLYNEIEDISYLISNYLGRGIISSGLF